MSCLNPLICFCFLSSKSKQGRSFPLSLRCHRKEFSAKWLLFRCSAKMAAARDGSRNAAIAEAAPFPITFHSLRTSSDAVFSLCERSDCCDEQIEGRSLRNELGLCSSFARRGCLSQGMIINWRVNVSAGIEGSPGFRRGSGSLPTQV